MKKISLLLAVFMIFPFTVLADCASDFKAVEKDFKVSYKYNRDTDDFDITFINPDKTKYTFGYHNGEEIKNFTISIQNNKETLVLSNYKGTKYEYNFVAISGSCANNVANSGTIELKKYNPYSDSELCKGNEDFVLCQRNYDKAIDEDTFKTRLELYIKSKENTEQNNNNNINNNKSINNNDNNVEKISLIDKIINYIQNNLVQVIIIVILLIALVIGAIIYTRRAIKSRRLE